MVINFALDFNQPAKCLSLDESTLAFYNDALVMRADGIHEIQEKNNSGIKRSASSPNSAIEGE